MEKRLSSGISITFSVSSPTDIVDDDGNVIGDAAYALQAELNSDDNNGKTRFPFGGAAPIFRLYKSENIPGVLITPSDGSVSVAGSGTAKIEEFIAFVGRNKTTVRFPITGGFLAEAVGKADLGEVAAVGGRTVQCAAKETDPSKPVVGVYRVQYNTEYTRHRLVGVIKPDGFDEMDTDVYPVVVHIQAL